MSSIPLSASSAAALISNSDSEVFLFFTGSFHPIPSGNKAAQYSSAVLQLTAPLQVLSLELVRWETGSLTHWSR